MWQIYVFFIIESIEFCKFIKKIQKFIGTIARNVSAAWRRRRLTDVCAGYKTSKFALTFARAAPPLAPNRPLYTIFLIILSAFYPACTQNKTPAATP